MIHQVVKLQALGNYRLRIEFEDGVQGDIDVSQIVPFEGVFTPLKNPVYFATVEIDEELGTICWDNGADISPCHLYSLLANKAA